MFLPEANRNPLAIGQRIPRLLKEKLRKAHFHAHTKPYRCSSKNLPFKYDLSYKNDNKNLLILEKADEYTTCLIIPSFICIIINKVPQFPSNLTLLIFILKNGTNNKLDIIMLIKGDVVCNTLGTNVNITSLYMIKVKI